MEGWPFGGLGDLVVPNWWSTVGSKRGSLEAAAACLALIPIAGVVGGFRWVVLCGDLGSSGVSLLGPTGSTLATRGWSRWAPALAPDGEGHGDRLVPDVAPVGEQGVAWINPDELDGSGKTFQGVALGPHCGVSFHGSDVPRPSLPPI